MEQDQLFDGARVGGERREQNVAEDRYARFVAAYAKSLNATQAAIEAGYSAKTAKQQGSRLMKVPEIQARLREFIGERHATLIADAEETLESISMHLRYDVRKMLKRDGSLRNLAELGDTEAHAVEGIRWDKDGGITIKLASKGAAQDKLSRYHSLYRDRVDVKLGLEKVIVPVTAKTEQPALPSGPDWG